MLIFMLSALFAHASPVGVESPLLSAARSMLQVRTAALLAHDPHRLTALLSPDYRYIDSLGRVFDRSAYLARVAGRELVWKSQDFDELDATELAPEVFLITGRAHDRFDFAGTPVDAWFRVVHVCLRTPQGPLFRFGQSTTVERRP